MTTITTPRHRKPRPGLSAKVAPTFTSRKGLVVTGTLLSVPATAASLVHAAPSFADPSGKGSGSGTQQRTTASTAGMRAAATHQVVTLQLGSRGSLVKTVQQRLGGLSVDGIFGTRTQTKVRAFQRTKGLAADGIVGQLTWRALGGFPGSSPAPKPPAPKPPTGSCSVQVLRYGSTGSLVSSAQAKLGGVAVDGVFGSATLTRLKSFQASHGLAVDGVVGPLTWRALGGYPCGQPPATNPPPPSGSRGVAAVIPIAEKYLGIPYVWGGSSPSQGFDCSGLTSYVYRQAGLSIPRTASQQQRALRSTSNPQPGDLVFFGYPAYHVGIYLGNNMMIAAPHPGDVVKKEQIWTTPTGYGTLR